MPNHRPTLDQKPNRAVGRFHFAAAAALFAGLLFYGSWLPFQWRELPIRDAVGTFRTILDADWRWSNSKQDVAVNLLVGIPIGFCLSAVILFRNRRPLPIVASVVLAIGASAVLSAIAEFGQLWIQNRVPSPRDIVAQIVGATAGSLGWVVAGRWFADQIDRMLATGRPSTKLQALLNLYVAGFVLWSLFPFAPVTSVGEIGRKLVNGEIELRPFAFPYKSTAEMIAALLRDVLVYLPVGVWASLAGRGHLQRIRNGWSAAVLSMLFACGIEVAQVFIKGRYASLTDVGCGVAGSLGGIALVRFLAKRRRGHDWHLEPRATANAGFWAVLSFVYAALLLVLFWQPFEFTRNEAELKSRIRQFADVPFRQMQAGGSDAGALFGTVANLGWFVPLGLLAGLAIRSANPPGRTRWIWSSLTGLLIAAFALMLEAGQLLIPNRTADLTSVGFQTLGGLAGLIGIVALAPRPRS